jgi:hypothetical protein
MSKSGTKEARHQGRGVTRGQSPMKRLGGTMWATVVAPVLVWAVTQLMPHLSR